MHTDLDLAPGSDRSTRRTFNVRGVQTVLTAAAAGRVSRVILVTSAMVYGARPDNPVPLPESAPLAADLDGSVVGDLLEIEDLARRSPRTNPGMTITVVRPAALVGPGVDTFVTRHFEAPRLLTVKGSEPRWQFCHTDDLLAALELAVAGEVTGAFAVGCDGWLDQDQVEELSGLRRIELPAGLTFGAAQRLHRVGITPAPATDLSYVVYPWVVDCATLRAAGWRPGYDNQTALAALLEQRTGHHAVAGGAWRARRPRSPQLGRPSRSSAPRRSSAARAAAAARRPKRPVADAACLGGRYAQTTATSCKQPYAHLCR